MASPSSTSSPSPSSPPWRPSLCSLSSPSGTHWQGEERWRSRSRASPTSLSFSSQLVSIGFMWSHPVSLLESSYVLNETARLPWSQHHLNWSFNQSQLVSFGLNQAADPTDRWHHFLTSPGFFIKSLADSSTETILWPISVHPSEIPMLPVQHSMYGGRCYPCHLRENLK